MIIAFILSIYYFIAVLLFCGQYFIAWQLIQTPLTGEELLDSIEFCLGWPVNLITYFLKKKK